MPTGTSGFAPLPLSLVNTWFGHLPAIVVHRGLVARAVGDQVSRIRQRSRSAGNCSGDRYQARRNESRHHSTVQRVLRWRGGTNRPGEADQPGQGAVSGDGYHQGRGVRLLRQHRRGDAPAYRRPAPPPASAGPTASTSPSFFEKQLASSAPDWLNRASITHRSGTTTYPIIDTVEALAWIGQQAALEVHVPQWRFISGGRSGAGEDAVKPGPATRLVFDLDPGEGVTMPQLCEVAAAVRDLMGDIGLTTYPLTSGSKGLHLYAPLDEPVSSRGCGGAGQTRCAATGEGDAEAGHLDDDQEPPGREGVSGLEPEQRIEDDDRAVLATRTRASHSRRAPHLGRDRRSQAAASAIRRGAEAHQEARRLVGAARRRGSRRGQADDIPQHARRGQNA